MASTDETERVETSPESESMSQSSGGKSKLAYLLRSLKRGLASVITILKLYLMGLAYQFGGVLGAMLIAFVAFVPWTALKSTSEAVQYSGTVVGILIAFTVYGAVALKFERAREENQSFELNL